MQSEGVIEEGQRNKLRSFRQDINSSVSSVRLHVMDLWVCALAELGGLQTTLLPDCFVWHWANHLEGIPPPQSGACCQG